MNIYEQWVFDALEKAKLQVFVPYKDRGVDAVISDGASRFLRVQIKGSRSYHRSDGGWGGWILINPKKLKESVSITDLWICVWPKIQNRGGLSPEFLAIPPRKLFERLDTYAKPSRGQWTMYLGRYLPRCPGEVIDDRGLKQSERGISSIEKMESSRVYTQYLINDWRVIFSQYAL